MNKSTFVWGVDVVRKAGLFVFCITGCLRRRGYGVCGGGVFYFVDGSRQNLNFENAEMLCMHSGSTCIGIVGEYELAYL